jgi:gas vesicle protein
MMRNNGDMLEEVIYEKFNELISVVDDRFPKIGPKTILDDLDRDQEELENYIKELRSFLIGYVRGVIDGTR